MKLFNYMFLAMTLPVAGMTIIDKYLINYPECFFEVERVTLLGAEQNAHNN